MAVRLVLPLPLLDCRVTRSWKLTVLLLLSARERRERKTMAFNDNWNRRTFLGALGALVGLVSSGRKAFAFPGGKAASVSGFGATGNVYEELGRSEERRVGKGGKSECARE